MQDGPVIGVQEYRVKPDQATEHTDGTETKHGVSVFLFVRFVCSVVEKSWLQRRGAEDAEVRGA